MATQKDFSVTRSSPEETLTLVSQLEVPTELLLNLEPDTLTLLCPIVYEETGAFKTNQVILKVFMSRQNDDATPNNTSVIFIVSFLLSLSDSHLRSYVVCAIVHNFKNRM